MSGSSAIPDHVCPHQVRDFNFYTSPEMTPTEFGDPQAATSQLHDGPPIFYSTANTHNGAGAWVIVRAEDQRRLLQDNENFTSHRASFSGGLGESWPLIPLEIDPPKHAIYRAIINPLLSPKRVTAMETQVRGRATDIIDRIVAKGTSCDAMVDFAFPFAVSIFLQFLGLPNDRLEEFVGWANGMFRGDPEVRFAASQKVLAFIDDLADQRRRKPEDDVMTVIAHAQIEGHAATQEEVRGMSVLLFIAGLDTVAAAIGFDLYHMVRYPEDQTKLRDNPSAIPMAVEEMLRAYATITPIRIAIRDIEILGVNVKKGDHLSFPTMVSNRDPKEFSEPDRVILDREDNRHVSFAYGAHRCVGSHLARREVIVALEEWLRRIPPFRILAGTAPRTFGGYVFGVENLMLDWS